MSAKTAIQTCTQLPEDNITIIALRLTFGGAPGPFDWGVISKTVCDLAMAILKSENWNSNTLYAPNHNLVPSKAILDSGIPFAEEKQLIVDIPVNPRGIVDVYIDDTVGLTVDLEG